MIEDSITNSFQQVQLAQQALVARPGRKEPRESLAQVHVAVLDPLVRVVSKVNQDLMEILVQKVQLVNQEFQEHLALKVFTVDISGSEAIGFVYCKFL